ncbi:membrane protein DedA with SNARE-associated domain [Pseudonocardia hierapolitana]|uniref:Membrane protein DedA with SNARE-associated domain n=1 Tax=Pseudonocardia hierapolitana TaxID=1128676 RepID=A0A561SV19_9PSEU|nr:VTT domain-containing protein [Pseudonocardia hierapolitana]TWF78708.1 membrane protein DedA with SNARE-associated domain [Pseudonocardia hierapolitana]
MIDGLRLLLDGALASQWLLLVIVGLAVVDALLPMVPSEALIIAAGVGAAAGDQSLIAVIAAASTGSFIGECTAFLVGRGFGAAVRGRLAPGSSRAELFARSERALTTRGGLILLTARYIPAGRTVAALAAGASRFPVRRYVGYSALGATMSAAYVAMLGFLGGAAFASDPLVALAVSLGIGTAIGSVAGLVRRLRSGTAAVVERVPMPTPVAA